MPYLRLAEGITSVETEGLEHYLRCVDGFAEGRHRLIIPFRHIAKADAPVLGALFGQILSRRSGIRDMRYWIHFLFGDMVLDWAGAGARWLFPRVGALPVSNQRLVRSQILAIRRLLLEGEHPLGIAPEGQVNYYNHRPGPLTGGLTHFIRWVLEAGKPVMILPAAVCYRYRGPGSVVSRALEESSRFTSRSCADLDGAAAALTAFLLDYLSGPGTAADAESPEAAIREIRRLITAEAKEAYPISGQKPLEELFLFRNFVFGEMRRRDITVPAIMKRIRGGWESPASLNALERLYQRQQLLDIMLNFDPAYHRTAENGDRENRECEQALYLLDIMNRIRGGDINSRFFPAGTTAVVHFAPPAEFRPGDDPAGWEGPFLRAVPAS